VTESGERPVELSDRARRWAETLAPHPLVEVVAVGGGITRTKWVLQLAEGDPLVLRWTDPQIWGEIGREHVRRESLACRILAGSSLPVPRLVASDPDGVETGGPTNLLSWRPGSVRLERLAPAAITALAEVAVAVHRQVVPVENRPPVFSFRGAATPKVPGWARWPDLWRRAIDFWASGAPPTPYGLMHGDFHFGNLLWAGDTVTGVVDWAETSWGPPDLDVAHVCSDFAMLHNVAEAEAFRTAYVERGGGLDPDPEAARFWVVSDILGFLPDPAHILPGMMTSRPDLTPAMVRRGLEDLLAVTLG